MFRARVIAAVVLSGMTAMAGCHRSETLTPEAKAERGKAMLRQMSQTLAGVQAFSYASEMHQTTPGKPDPAPVTRQVTVRRPNGIAYTGDQTAAWYDGKSLTFVSHRHKAWARGPMPATLDEAIDFLMAEYALHIPTADLLYTSPYDALMGPDTQGGWVDVQTLDGASYEHLAYTTPKIDWEIWLSQDDRRLPRQLKLTYNTEPGPPTVRVVLSKFDTSPKVDDATFTAKVPDGYERIKVMRHATVEDTSAAAPAPAQAPAGQTTTPRQ